MRLAEAIVALARRYGRRDCRRIKALLRQAGKVVNAKRVERRAIVRHRSGELPVVSPLVRATTGDGERRREGLAAPGRQP